MRSHATHDQKTEEDAVSRQRPFERSKTVIWRPKSIKVPVKDFIDAEVDAETSGLDDTCGYLETFTYCSDRVADGGCHRGQHHPGLMRRARGQE